MLIRHNSSKRVSNPTYQLLSYTILYIVFLFGFPKDLSMKTKWAKYYNIPVQMIDADQRLCEIHFSKDDIIDYTSTGSKKCVKRNEFPTIPWNPSALDKGKQYIIFSIS